jgi:hypothetical protein
MLRNSLLTIHILGVIAWLGRGAYELLLSHEVRRARGTIMEIPLIRVYGRYAGLVVVATLVVACAGGAMASFLGWGFFTSLWLGIKQAIMLAILLAMAIMLPVFIRTANAIKALPDSMGPQLDSVRTLLERVDRHVIAMRFGALVAVVLAVWGPS